jgi:hypothetical protein
VPLVAQEQAWAAASAKLKPTQLNGLSRLKAGKTAASLLRYVYQRDRGLTELFASQQKHGKPERLALRT